MKNSIATLCVLFIIALNVKAESPVNENVCMQAKADSQMHYTGKNSGAGWVTAATILTSPVLGLIPAVAISSTEPADHNLNYKNHELMQNFEYASCYREQAHKTKKSKVWRNYGIGAGVWLAIFLLL